MTIAMSEQVDAEPCDVLRGGDGPVYFLLGGQLYVVHEVLGRWIEADQDAAARPVFEPPAPEAPRGRNGGAGAGPAGSRNAEPASDQPQVAPPEPGSSQAVSSQAVPSQPVSPQPPSPQPPSPRPPSDESSFSASGEPRMADPPMVEHWLVTASVGRFGRPAVFRLQRRPAPPAKGPDSWTVRAERR